MPETDKTDSPMGNAGAAWALLAIVLLLGKAIYRLALRAVEALQMELGLMHWGVLAGWVFFMAYCEGYRGFQKSFSPRTAARIHHLRVNPTILHCVLAPVFVMGFFYATRRTKIVAWALLFGIGLLVFLVSLMSQPWRGIIDAGVVVGLTWGVVSLVWMTFRPVSVSPELPVD